MQKLARAMRLVIQPLAFINVTICMPEFSKSACTVLSELAFIHAAVGAGHCAMSMAVAARPLASVDPATLKLYSPVRAATAFGVTIDEIVSGGL